VHELSICEAILHKIEANAEGRSVTAVTVKIGHLRQVVPDALRFSWEVVTDSTDHRGAQLQIDHVPAVVECHNCGQRTTLDLPILSCSGCESFEVTLISGDEFQLVSMDLSDS
jgi:hydrogenase nickel incorporation protein HypA/HybF